MTSDFKAYLLLTYIAYRAKRSDDEKGYSTLPLKINQAIISDYKTIGLTRGEYRGAQERLSHYGLVTFETNNKGTIATLISTDVVDINADLSPSFQEPASSSMKPHKEQPSENLKNPNKEPLTRNKEMKETTTTQQQADHILYECLTKYTKLSDKEKRALMIYPEQVVSNALEWVQLEKVKKSLPSYLHWYCRQKEPPEKPHPPGTEQQMEAQNYNQFLKETAPDQLQDLYKKNESAIPENYVHVLLDGRKTTLGLGNTTNELKIDFEKSKKEVLALQNKKNAKLPYHFG